MSVTGRLIGRSGAVAGKKFEISGEMKIGRAPGSDIVLATDAHARLFIQDDAFHIEGSGVSVDGTPVQGATRLDRMHVLEIGGVEIVFTRTAAPAAPAPEPAPAPPAPPAQSVGPPKQPESGGTMIDMAGFSALPELGKRTPPAPAPAPTPAPAPAPAPAQNAVPPKQPESGGTMIDMVGFGALPELGRPTPPAPAPPRAPAPAPAQSGASDATVPMQAFIPSAPEWVLAVTVPGQGAVTYMLKVGDNIVGRGEGCDIKIPDPEQWLSRKHANVRVGADGSVSVVDMKGINGTFVQGVRVDTAPLQAGGTFVLGPHLEFKLQER